MTDISNRRGKHRRSSHRFWLAHGCFVKFLMLLTVLAARGQTPTPVALFDQPCAKCHAKIFNEYLKTPMANASGPAADKVIASTLAKSYGKVSYSISSESSQLLLYYSQVAPPIEGSRTLEYFLGSGHLGTTYLYSSNGYLLESPVAYYNGSGLDLKPGIPATDRIASALPVSPACLRCHMSAVQHSDEGSMNHYQGAPFLHTGITCEACHSDASNHISSRGKLPVVNPAKLDEARRDSVCISCHLEGDASVEQAGRPALDYKPGDLISSYLSYFVLTDKGSMERGVSEVEQFNLSMCKRKTGAAMSCTSCHDPHFSPASAQKVDFYRAKCLTCHSSATFVSTHHPDHRDCTSCHMTKTGARNIPHVAWTDHRILRQPMPSQSSASLSASKAMIPLLNTQPSSRDLALAYYQASFKDGVDLQTKAYELLKGDEPGLLNDPDAMDGLGSMAGARGDFVEARKDFEGVLKSHPSDFSASANLGTLLARSGKLTQAIAAWAPAFARNEDIPGLAMNLALAQCRVGDLPAATTTLQNALTYSPGQKQLTELLGALPSCGKSQTKVSAKTE